MVGYNQEGNSGETFFAMILCVSMAVALIGAQAETAERTEGEQAALEILTRQMTASATSLIQWGEDVKNLYPELQVQQPSIFQGSFRYSFTQCDPLTHFSVGYTLLLR